MCFKDSTTIHASIQRTRFHMDINITPAPQLLATTIIIIIIYFHLLSLCITTTLHSSLCKYNNIKIIIRHCVRLYSCLPPRQKKSRTSTLQWNMMLDNDQASQPPPPTQLFIPVNRDCMNQPTVQLGKIRQQKKKKTRL